HPEIGRDLLDLIGTEITLLQGLQLALGLAEIEEQLLLACRGAHFHKAPGPENIFLNGGADPPHSVGGETEALVGGEALDRLHKPNAALEDPLAEGEAVAAVSHGNTGDKAQM